MENGKDDNALQVDPISVVKPSSGRVYLFWGIDKDYNTGDMSDVPLGIYKATSNNIGPYNSFNIGF